MMFIRQVSTPDPCHENLGLDPYPYLGSLGLVCPYLCVTSADLAGLHLHLRQDHRDRASPYFLEVHPDLACPYFYLGNLGRVCPYLREGHRDLVYSYLWEGHPSLTCPCLLGEDPRPAYPFHLFVA